MKKYLITCMFLTSLTLFSNACPIIADYSDDYHKLSAPMCLKQEAHYYTFFQLFLAEAKMYGLEYAINNSASNANVDGKMENLDFHFKLGGKLALGYLFNY